ncbi:MAG: class I SAM-dependent methyltransferase [Epsilonproteobacteria bacterium]|nr:class I SAM-dependent methyltransferase [Campylobacterota bacterium]
MTLETLRSHLNERALHVTDEFVRLFHGRGGLYEGFKHLVIDHINPHIINAAFYFEEDNEAEVIKLLEDFSKEHNYQTLVIQRRYLKGAPSEVIFGTLPDDLFILENGMKLKINLLSNKNSYYFPDMKNGRDFVRQNAQGKHILNLFSYTCAFSVAAKFGGAKSVINVDMSKGALKVGMANHALNSLEPKGVSFLPYNILKSFAALKKKRVYDMIIIDPPSFQRGSFEATKDYEKIITKLPQLASQNCTLLACLNAPELDEDFIVEKINRLAPSFKFVKRLENLEEFASANEARSLKNLVFERKN